MSDKGTVIAYVSGEALTEGRCVTYNTTDDDIEYADAVTEKVLGIVTADKGSGEKTPVQVDGIYENAIADGSGTEIEPGMHLMPKAGADGVLVAHDGNANSVYAAKALDGTTDSAGRIRVKILDSLPAEA